MTTVFWARIDTCWVVLFMDFFEVCIKTTLWWMFLFMAIISLQLSPICIFFNKTSFQTETLCPNSIQCFFPSLSPPLVGFFLESEGFWWHRLDSNWWTLAFGRTSLTGKPSSHPRATTRKSSGRWGKTSHPSIRSGILEQTSSPFDFFLWFQFG